MHMGKVEMLGRSDPGRNMLNESNGAIFCQELLLCNVGRAMKMFQSTRLISCFVGAPGAMSGEWVSICVCECRKSNE